MLFQKWSKLPSACATKALAWLEKLRGRAIWGPAELVYDDPKASPDHIDDVLSHGAEAIGGRQLGHPREVARLSGAV